MVNQFLEFATLDAIPVPKLIQAHVLSVFLDSIWQLPAVTMLTSDIVLLAALVACIAL
jgi:hypothetical protein